MIGRLMNQQQQILSLHMPPRLHQHLRDFPAPGRVHHTLHLDGFHRQQAVALLHRLIQFHRNS